MNYRLLVSVISLLQASKVIADVCNYPGRYSAAPSDRHGALSAQDVQLHYGRDNAYLQQEYSTPFARRESGVPTRHTRRRNTLQNERHLVSADMPYLKQHTVSPAYASSLLRIPGRQSPGPKTTKRDLKDNLHYRQGLKRAPLNRWYVQNSEIFGRGQTIKFGAMERRGDRFDSRSPKHKNPHQTKQQKKVDGAHKLLNDDLAKEKKAQDEAAAKALKSVDKAQTEVQKSVAGELQHEQKEAAKDQRRIDEAKANLAKVEANRGKPGKAGKAYVKAAQKLENAISEMAKHHSQGIKKMQGIDNDENKSIDKAGKKLDKEQKKAHTDQFGDKGARIAKEHPTAWQKFKKVIAKIGNAIDWAITGISLLIPGAEAEGLARLTAKGAEMIAKKATKEGVKKGADAGLSKLQKEQQHQEVIAAKTESDAQVAAAEANVQKGKDQFNQARQKAAHPAAGHYRRSTSINSWSITT